MNHYIANSISKIEEFEGIVLHMYRDTVGLVTVGIGLMLPSVEAAQALPFRIGARDATSEEIAEEFKRVRLLPAGKTPDFYCAEGMAELSRDVAENRLLDFTLAIDDTLRGHIRGYDDFPEQPKLALLDMGYNLGTVGLFREYPRMLAAVEAGDWSTAAQECSRRGPAPARNLWTRKMFLSAAAA